MYWAVRLRLRVRRRPGDVIGDARVLPARLRRPADGVPGHGLLRRHDRVEVVLPVRLLRGLAGDRLGHDARADQVRRLHHLRDRLLGADLPDRLALGLRRRLARRSTSACRTSPARRPSTSSARPAASRRCCLLGPRKGKYGADGKPRAIPGHNMPLFGLGVLILWLGWFGFNPGSTLNALDGRFAEIVAGHEPRRRRPACSARSRRRTAKTKTIDIGMAGNGAIAALVAITAPSGYVESVGGADHRRGRRRHRRRSASSRSTRSSTTRSARSRRTASPASGARSPAACSPRRAGRVQRASAIARPGLHGLVHAAGRPGARRRRRVRVRVRLSLRHVLASIKKTYGLRVTAEEEEAGLDISEHGMYGYPEQFIPAPELVGYGAAALAARARRRAGRPHQRR